MKNWLTFIIILAIVIVIFFIGIELIFENISGVECCPCYDGCYNKECIITNGLECCKCNYNIFEKIQMILYYYGN